MRVQARFIFALILLSTVAAMTRAELADPIDRVTAMAYERAQLAQARTASDSLRMLYNIFDLSLGSERAPAADTLYFTARRSGDYETILDATRHRANLRRNNNWVLQQMRNAIAGMPESKNLEETKLYIDMLLLRNSINRIEGDSIVHNNLVRLIWDYTINTETNPYRRAMQLYGLCLYTERATHGELLAYYYDELVRHVASMGFSKAAVSNMVYTGAAAALSRNGYYDRVLLIDRRMLDVMDSLRNDYRSAGRIYRNYETTRYASYRRMLGSYQLLTDSQLEQYYGMVRSLAERNAHIGMMLEDNPRARAFYMMGKHRYAEAVPLLLRCLECSENRPYRRRLLEALVAAADSTGNRAVELEALRELNGLLQSDLTLRRHDCSLELSLFSAVNDISEQKGRLEAQKRELAVKDKRITLMISAIALVVMLILIAVIVRQLKKARKVSEELEEVNARLRQEKHDLRHAQQELVVAHDEAAAANRLKSEFVATMTHEVTAPLNSIVEYTRLIVDCIPPDKAQYLDRFARNVEFNSKVILSLVKDVADSDALKKDGLIIERRPVSVYELAAISTDTIFGDGHPHNPDIEVVFNPSGRPDVFVLTDSHRASQVFTNLLGNAEKFSEKGTITLDFEPQPDKGLVEFSVTDCGTGIPDGMEELIFGRFRKASPSSPGLGLGLYIVRRIVTMLGGAVWVDTSYRRGARFVFTLPLAGTDGAGRAE